MKVMKTYSKRFSLTKLILFFTFLTAASSAFAALGGPESSISSDEIHFAGRHTVSKFQNYSRHDIVKKNLSLREYVTNDGKVFAVVWKSPAHPDFSTLFGNYFQDYQAARTQASERRASQKIRSRDLVAESGDLHIESSTHMAAQFGRAWAISLLPQGFNTNDIR